jgi:hypothetical protein
VIAALGRALRRVCGSAGLLLLAAGLSACAGPRQPPAPVGPGAPATPAASARGGAALPPAADTPRTPPSSAARRPVPDRTIDLDARCAQSEDDGFREEASLRVRDSQVQAFSWQLWVGRRGSCRFDLADFRQVRSRPHIELLARDGSGCKLMVWQDPRRITMAHAGCQRRCSAGIYEQAWPVMFDPRTGACAKLDR